jgi:hypothetical protein
MRVPYQKMPRAATTNVVKNIVASALRTGRRVGGENPRAKGRPGREREITVRYDDTGWTAIEFTDSAGGYLANNASYDAAVLSAIEFLAGLLADGDRPSLEIVIGHRRCYSPGHS